MKRYAEIGLKVHFTGIDVRCGRGGSQWSDCGITENEDWSEQMLANQTRVYTSLLSTCLNAPNCVSFVVADFQEKYRVI